MTVHRSRLPVTGAGVARGIVSSGWYGFGMDAALIARISHGHRRRLAWFEDHAGQITPPPPPLEGELPGGGKLHLVSTPKGIFKPGDLPYALSIKIKQGSPYSDGRIVRRADGGWRLAYHQEIADPADRDRSFTNRGLMRCIEDQVPVGALFEREAPGRRRRYEVLGLAMPVRWHAGYFFFESLDPPGAPVGDTVGEVLEATAEAEAEEAAQGEPLPADDYDARLRVFRQIAARRGQGEFRARLLEAYSGRCAVTGCDVAPALEAAHLRPYRGPEFNTVDNGLLLRADIHTLLDLQLLAFDPHTRQLILSRQLQASQYENLAGARLAEPALAIMRPRHDHLVYVWEAFSHAEAVR